MAPCRLRTGAAHWQHLALVACLLSGALLSSSLSDMHSTESALELQDMDMLRK